MGSGQSFPHPTHMHKPQATPFCLQKTSGSSEPRGLYFPGCPALEHWLRALLLPRKDRSASLLTWLRLPMLKDHMLFLLS
jgi:hypothetical protein